MDTLSVAQIGLSLQASKTQMSMNAALLKKNLDIEKQQGEMIVQLLEAANVRGNIDTYA